MPKIKTYIFWVVFSLMSTNLSAAEWQWSVPVSGTVSKETSAHPTAFLWIPPNCKQLRGVIIGQHNMLEEGIFEHQSFRNNLAKLGVAEIWITPGPDMIYNCSSVKIFDTLINDLAEKSGYAELKFVPIIPMGHSAAASYPWNFGACSPERTLAILSIHGDAPLTNMTGSGQPNPSWGNSNIDGIPSLFVMGEYEWLEGRIAPAIKYKKEHPNATIALFCDAGHGHFDFSYALIEYLNLFISKAVNARLPKKIPSNGPVKLIKLNPENGWLIDRWRNDVMPTAVSAPFLSYKGDKGEAGWAFDSEMARATEHYYSLARGKKIRNIGYLQDGKLLPPAGFAGFRPIFKPMIDGLSFRIGAVNIDTKGNIINTIKHDMPKINITRICGPVVKVNDSTFKIAFYRMGFDNPKRSNDIWLMASQAGDEVYKTAVQQADMRIPIVNKSGREQKISFPAITNQKLGTGVVKLNAHSDAAVPVEYYVKDGPAEIQDGKLIFTKIPPRSRFPITVTVVAWQYGYDDAERKIKSASPVEQKFKIYK
jgi:hypothetical protein